jgi:hypothetical protein
MSAFPAQSADVAISSVNDSRTLQSPWFLMDSIFADAALLRKMTDPPADPSSEFGSVFPLGLYRDFLEAIRQRDVQVITYRDLFEQSGDWDYKNGYKSEYAHWRSNIRDPQRIYLLIQHDVDYVPNFTKRMMALEALYGVRSNIFLFHELYESDRPGPYNGTPYDVDHGFFHEAQRCGFVIGYHQNAFALAGFQMEPAIERFRRDVAALSNLYDIEFFCPHGGPGGEVDGKKLHNHDVPVPPELTGRLRWVYNRHGPRFAGRWSDGGIWQLTDPERLQQLDILKFVDSMQPGHRYFALIHPQLWGYHIDKQYVPALAEQGWYQQACARHMRVSR